MELIEADKFGQISKVHFELNALKDSALEYVKSCKILNAFYDKIENSINQRFEKIFNSWGNTLYAAAILNPNSLYSSLLSVDQKNEGIKLIKQMKIGQTEQDTSFEGETSAQKDFIKRHQINTNEAYDELRNFMQLSPNKKSNLLEFWISHKEQFPKLYEISMKLLSIPTSSASIERVFSKAKELLGVKQLRMNEDLVEKRMIILGNKDLFEELFDEKWFSYFIT